LIARELNELALAQHVAARVADLREEQMAVDQGGDRHGRPHTSARAIDLRLLEDAKAGRLDGSNEPAREIVTGEPRRPFRRTRRTASRADRPRATGSPRGGRGPCA